MRTVGYLFPILLLLSAPALAQPDDGKRPNGMTEKEYQQKKAEIKARIDRLETEYARYAADATGFEGVWRVSGSRTYSRRGGDKLQVQDYEGELWITREDGDFVVEGKVRLKGRNSGKWEGAGALDGDALEEDYESTVGGKGTARYTLKPDGSLEIAWASEQRGGPTKPEAKGQGTAVRALPIAREELEKQLFEANHELQFLRYPRPEPTKYESRSGNFEMRFTPTVEYDPNGVENYVIGLIGQATKTIDLCVFEFSLPRVARALVKANKERGVRVRMVFDDREEEQEAVKILHDNGIEAKSDQRSAYMHNKFMVIDAEDADKALVWTGSTNISPGGIYVADNHSLLFKNQTVAKTYTTEFEEMFVDGSFGPKSPQNTSHDWVRIDQYTKVQVYFAPEDGAMDRLIEAVRSAKKSIKIIAFAFTSTKLFQAVTERMKDGVKVEAIFESRHAGWKDIKIGPLNAAGATVRFDVNPDALHHKVIVIDEKLVCTGSFNFSDSADRENDENMLVLDGRAAARAFVRELDALMSTTDPSDPRIATSGMPDKNDRDGIMDMLKGLNGN
ncbi:MAG: phosphatidylserine/phosphatidylglycerophosphate/cardiolipin synthase family protein [Planctomycetota bacterium]